MVQSAKVPVKNMSDQYLRQRTAPDDTADTALNDNNIEDDAYLPYDVSADFSCEVMDHAPTTSHGTYLDGIDDGLEPLEDYTEGGYHPIHLNDYLEASMRYRVLHKVGHGGFGTVWLCRDEQTARYVAVKVMTGETDPKDLADLSLARLDQSFAGAEYIAIPTDDFVIEGPNGKHQCIVLPLLGPRVAPDLWMHMDREPGPVLRKMAHQSAQALQFLHENKLCHGDFRPSNILVKLVNLDHLNEEELNSLLQPPQTVPVRTETGDALPSSSPKYLVHPVELSKLDAKYLTDDVCVIDFGESYFFSSPPEDLGMPEHYLPPEVLMDEDGAIGPACDIWALGCTLFEIRQQIPLFYMLPDTDELLTDMVRLFGKLPATWWDKWEGRSKFFDEQGKYIRYGYHTEQQQFTLDICLNKTAEVWFGRMDDPATKHLTMHTPEPEQKLMGDLLYKLLRYEPGQRASLEEVVNHGWFRIEG